MDRASKPYVPCKVDGTGVQLKESVAITANATTQATQQYTVTTGRGDVQALQVLPASNVIADLSNVTLTIKANGSDIYTDVPLLAFSTLFQSDRSFDVIVLPQSSTVDITYNNTGGVAYKFFINFLYFNPYNQ